jgi:glutamate synthase (NADPH/NADH) small chain
MELGEPDESGRRRPVEVADSEYEIECDTVIMSHGTSPNPLISSMTSGLDINRWQCIVAPEENGQTYKLGVFAGGDAGDRRSDCYHCNGSRDSSIEGDS